jgi:hypothetical protein
MSVDVASGWALTIDAEADERFEPDRLDQLAEQLEPYSGVVTGPAELLPRRFGATFSIDDAPGHLEAVAEGDGIFTKAVTVAGLPEFQVVAVEVMTFLEQDRQLAQPSMPELVGVAEVAEVLGVSRQRASELRGRPGFPSPVADLASGPVWSRPSLDRFVETWERRAGRPPKPPVLQLPAPDPAVALAVVALVGLGVLAWRNRDRLALALTSSVGSRLPPTAPDLSAQVIEFARTTPVFTLPPSMAAQLSATG